MNLFRDYHDKPGTEPRLSEFLSATVRYIPLITALLALGLLALYWLSRSNLLGDPAWQIAAGAAASVAIGLLHLPLGSIARRGSGFLAVTLFWILLAGWSLSIVLLWEVVVVLAILMAWVASGVAFSAGVRGRRLTGLSIASLLLSVLLVWLDSHPPLARLTSTNSAGLAAIILLSSTVLLFFLGTIFVRLFKYRSVQNRLVVTFVLIMAIPVLVTTAVSATTAVTNSQHQFGDSLVAVSTLKRDQINAPLATVREEINTLQDGSGKASSILNALYRKQQSDADYQKNLATAEKLLSDILVQYPSSDYEQILALDAAGRVGLSSFGPDEGTDFSNQIFYREGLKGFFAEVLDFPGKANLARDYKLVVAAPFQGSSGQEAQGVVVAVINRDKVLSVAGSTAGIARAQTYLVGRDLRLIGETAGLTPQILTPSIANAIMKEQPGTAQTYVNYLGQSVLGYAVWDPAINAVVVSEIPSSDIYGKALASLLVSALVGLFAILVAVIAALSSAQAISDPIRSLAGAARALTAGDLTVRATSEQRDEVANLADSFNAMAAQLEGTIGNLEQRITERTQALERQSLRLRAAAEVARDAASAPDLDTLLDQAASLIRDRFGFYHTGIFLLDGKKEYAILRSSPSEAGHQMLANQHKLRVGEQGIVGRAAATGEPRIALDTGADPVYFSNPLLPNTHSEMALPLKTAEGTIGVIDIQSDQREAFTQDDIAIVQVMADQLATAIQRADLLQQVRSQLSQLERSYQSFTEQSWRTFGRSGHQNVGYRFDNVRLESIKSVPEEVRPVFENGGTPSKSLDGQNLQIPIRLRGQVIGVVQLRLQSARPSETTAIMIQQVADRLATALENARLLEDSLRRANKERAIGEITAKISASVNMRNVLQTAVEELGRAIPGSEVLIQFRPDKEIQ